jgi:hypothetical protein
MTPINSYTKEDNEPYVSDFKIEKDGPRKSLDLKGVEIIYTSKNTIQLSYNELPDMEFRKLYMVLLKKHLEDKLKIEVIIKEATVYEMMSNNIIKYGGFQEDVIITEVNMEEEDFIEWGDGKYLDLYKELEESTRSEIEKQINENALTLKKSIQPYL